MQSHGKRSAVERGLIAPVPTADVEFGRLGDGKDKLARTRRRAAFQLSPSQRKMGYPRAQGPIGEMHREPVGGDTELVTDFGKVRDCRRSLREEMPVRVETPM